MPRILDPGPVSPNGGLIFSFKGDDVFLNLGGALFKILGVTRYQFTREALGYHTNCSIDMLVEPSNNNFLREKSIEIRVINIKRGKDIE